MKIYTKTGDDGTTGMIGGTRAKKSDARIDCYGTVDELNAFIGLAACVCVPADPLLTQLRRVQNELFVIGSHLAVPSDANEALRAKAHLPELKLSMIEQMEKEIDAAESALPPLQQFILPGGSELAARLHVARGVCRHAERKIVALEPAADSSATMIVTYFNRLSDWLFVMARLANHSSGIADVPWVK